MLNKHYQRQVNALHVFCRHEDRGCGWCGELSDLERHIQSCPMTDTPLMTDLLQSTLYVNITRDNVNNVIIYRYKDGDQDDDSTSIQVLNVIPGCNCF